MSLPDPANQETAPIVLNPGQGRSVGIGSGSVCTFKVTGKNTHGHFGLFEYTMKPHTAGPRPHIHKKMEEIFYVADGEVEFLVGDRRVTARKGTIAVVPRGTAHAFSNPGAQTSVLHIMFCPAGYREKYFEGLAELTKGGRTPDAQALLKLMKSFDQEPVDTSAWTF